MRTARDFDVNILLVSTNCQTRQVAEFAVYWSLVITQLYEGFLDLASICVPVPRWAGSRSTIEAARRYVSTEATGADAASGGHRNSRRRRRGHGSRLGARRCIQRLRCCQLAPSEAVKRQPVANRGVTSEAVGGCEGVR